MAEAPENAERQVSWEREQRPRIATFAGIGGLLMLIGTLLPELLLTKIPSVGFVEGLAPVLRGQANPAVSPHTPVIRYLSHHAAPLIVGSAIEAVGLAGLAIALHFLFGAVRFRRPEVWTPAGLLVLYAPLAVGVLSVAAQIAQAILTHRFATGHNFTDHAADYATIKAPARVAVGYLSLLAELGLLIGIFNVSLNAMRTGLLTRGLAGVGMVVAVIPILLSQVLGVLANVIPPLWAIALGILLMRRWPSGDPPAWEAGRAIAWPGAAERSGGRASRAPAAPRGRGRREPQPAVNEPVAAVASAPTPAPAPTPAARGSSRRKKRKGRGGSRR